MTDKQGWHPDPTGRFPLRYFDGDTPTDWISDGTEISHAPLTPSPGPPVRSEAAVAKETPGAGPLPLVRSPRTVGWYRNSGDPTWFRYWDGERWSEPSVAPLPTSPSPTPGNPAKAAGHPTPTQVDAPPAVGWYRNVIDATRFRHWDGIRWSKPVIPRQAGPRATPATLRPAAPDVPEASEAEPPESAPTDRSQPDPTATAPRARGRRPRVVLTAAEVLAMALALAGVITFAVHSAGSDHSSARIPKPASSANTVRPTTTVAPTTTTVPRVDPVAFWWAAAGSDRSAALAADLTLLQADATNRSQLATHCPAIEADVAAATSIPPAPDPGIEREWQLTLSTSQRVAAACSVGGWTRATTDIEPALYTIRDLERQVSPHLAGPAS